METERFDKGREYVFHTILKNDRLKTYAYYLALAKENGYHICPMLEFYKNPIAEKHFVLRHDVDHKTPATRKMYNLEKKYHVHSTYYFRKSTVDINLMNDMIDAGFEVGFHYETLSDYAIENNLNHVTEKDIEICRIRLKQEIEEFNKLIKKPIYSVASHGHKKMQNSKNPTMYCLKIKNMKILIFYLRRMMKQCIPNMWIHISWMGV